MAPASMIELKRQPFHIEKDPQPDVARRIPRFSNFETAGYRILLKASQNPLTKNASRSVSIDYLSELEHDKRGNRFFFCPANVAHESVEFQLDVQVHLASRPDVLVPKFVGEQFAAIKFQSRQIGQSTIHTSSITSPAGPSWRIAPGTVAVALTLPAVANSTPTPNILVQKSPFNDEEGVHYFCIYDTAPVARLSDFSEAKNRIAIFWDSSLSRLESDRLKEIELVLKLAQAFFATIGDGAIDLYLLRDDHAQKYVFGPGDLVTLEKSLSAVFYSGCTRIDRLRLDPATESSVRFALLFSDGWITLGGQTPPPPPVENVVPISVVARRSDRPNDFILRCVPCAVACVFPLNTRSRYYCDVTGGQYFDLDVLNIDRVVSQVLAPPMTLSILPGTDPVFHVHSRAIPASESSGPSFLITGRTSKSGQAKLEASCLVEGVALQTKTYFIDVSSSAPSSVVALKWASMHLESLLVDPIRAEKLIVDTSSRFGLATPLTKIEFIDGNSGEEFAVYDVAPPPERVHALKSFLDLRITQAQKKLDTEAFFVFESEKKWSWITDYHLDVKKRPSKQQEPIKEKSSQPAVPALSPLLQRIKGVWKAPVWDSTDGYHSALAMPGSSTESLRAAFVSFLPSYKGKAAFFYDFAYAMFHVGNNVDRLFARHVLLCILDLQIPSAHLLRSMAYLLESQSMMDVSLELYDRVLRLAPTEPTSKRDLANALIKAGPRFYLRALSMLQSIVTSEVPQGNEINVTALIEWNALCFRATREGCPVSKEVDFRLGGMRRDIQADIRICMSWDTETRDFDLHVTEPDGFIVYYHDKESPKCGFLQEDVRCKYGPEQYMQVRADPGTYTIWTNLHVLPMDHPLLGPSTILLKVYFNWGRATQKEHVRCIRVTQSTKFVVLGMIQVPQDSVDMEGASFTAGGVMDPPKVAAAPASPAMAVSPRRMNHPQHAQQVRPTSTFISQASVNQALSGTGKSMLRTSRSSPGIEPAANNPALDSFFEQFSLSVDREPPLPTGAVQVSNTVASTMEPVADAATAVAPASPQNSPRLRPPSQKLPPLTSISTPSSRTGPNRPKAPTGAPIPLIPIQSPAAMSSSPPLRERALANPPPVQKDGASPTTTGRKESKSASSPRVTPRGAAVGQTSSSSNSPVSPRSNSVATTASKRSKSPPTSPRSAVATVAMSNGGDEMELPRGISGASIQYAVEAVALGIDEGQMEDPKKKDNCTTM